MVHWKDKKGNPEEIIQMAEKSLSRLCKPEAGRTNNSIVVVEEQICKVHQPTMVIFLPITFKSFNFINLDIWM